MITNTTILDKAKLIGGLSTDLTNSDFFKAFTAGEKVGGYIGSEQRTPDRDKIIEAYLKSKGCLPNSSAFLLGSKAGAKLMDKVSKETKLREFLEIAKSTFESPIPTIYELLKSANIHELSHLNNKLKEENIRDAEEGIKKYLKLKNGKVTEVNPSASIKKGKAPFEGRYENTEGTSNKFWEIYENNNGLYTAEWGRIERGVQGSKDDYSYSEARYVASKKLANGYVKVL
jgi:hypothetical protein